MTVSKNVNEIIDSSVFIKKYLEVNDLTSMSKGQLKSISSGIVRFVDRFIGTLREMCLAECKTVSVNRNTGAMLILDNLLFFLNKNKLALKTTTELETIQDKMIKDVVDVTVFIGNLVEEANKKTEEAEKIIEENFNNVSSIETSVRQFGYDVKKAVQEGVSQQELLKIIDGFINNFNGTQVDVVKTIQ